MGRGFLGSEFAPFSPPASPRQSPNSELGVRDRRESGTRDIKINYQTYCLPSDVASDVIKALYGLRRNSEYARVLKKELILNADLLIPLVNATKLETQHNRHCLASDKHYSCSIELAFIENENLSADESEWVKDTIYNYKQMVKSQVVQNNPAPIAPPPSVIRL